MAALIMALDYCWAPRAQVTFGVSTAGEGTLAGPAITGTNSDLYEVALRRSEPGRRALPTETRQSGSAEADVYVQQHSIGAHTRTQAYITAGSAVPVG